MQRYKYYFVEEFRLYTYFISAYLALKVPNYLTFFRTKNSSSESLLSFESVSLQFFLLVSVEVDVT
jgi:hypothetical protein